MSEAIGDQQLDLDKDGQTSILEAFLAANWSTQDFYKTQSRLASEHALVDDNGDKKGTAADWFEGIRVSGKARDGASPDGFRANQIVLWRRGEEAEWSAESIAQRNAMELELENLRQKKADLPEDVYYRQIEKICLKIARLYEDNAPAESQNDH